MFNKFQMASSYERVDALRGFTVALLRKCPQKGVKVNHRVDGSFDTHFSRAKNKAAGMVSVFFRLNFAIVSALHVRLKRPTY